MAFPTIQELLESGVHFGHQTRRWNPKMKKFIFAERNGIHIIDLKKTLDHLKQAADKVRDIAAEGGNILFVGTKKQLKDIIRDEAERCGMYYVNERWLGGMMTNFQTIKKNIRRLRELERMRDEGELEVRSKKEALSLNRELDKLKKTLEGIKMLGDIPSAMFVVDAQKEKIAVAEANKLGIPLIALIDTNADPEKISFPVAGNDDAIRSVKVITEAIAEAVMDGKAEYDQKVASREAEKKQEQQAGGGRQESRGGEQDRRPRPRRRTRKKRSVGEGGAPYQGAPGQGQKQNSDHAKSASASRDASGKAAEKTSSAKAPVKKDAVKSSPAPAKAKPKQAAEGKPAVKKSAPAEKTGGKESKPAKKAETKPAKAVEKKSSAKSGSTSAAAPKAAAKKKEEPKGKE
jgi:small subunit ribosomal protein S2